MGWLGTPEDRDQAPVAAATSERDDAIRWARELIAQGVKVVRLRSSTGPKAKSDEVVGRPRPTEQ